VSSRIVARRGNTLAASQRSTCIGTYGLADPALSRRRHVQTERPEQSLLYVIGQR
jgi:hypothetical protein